MATISAKVIRICCLEQKTISLVCQNLGNATNPRGNNWTAQRHGFYQGEEAFSYREQIVVTDAFRRRATRAERVAGPAMQSASPQARLEADPERMLPASMSDLASQ